MASAWRGGGIRNVSVNGSHDGRVHGYLTQDNEVGFKLSGVTDAGNYGCRHEALFYIVQDYSAVLFVYGKYEMQYCYLLWGEFFLLRWSFCKHLM